MKYLVTYADNSGLEYAYTLDEIQTKFAEKTLPPSCRVRFQGKEKHISLDAFLANPEELSVALTPVPVVKARSVPVQTVPARGCLEPLLILFGAVFMLALLVSWLMEQDSVSKSLGELTGKAVKPIVNEYEKFREGFKKSK